MVRLQYNLDEIPERPYEPGKYAARLKAIKQRPSKAGNRMLEFEWLMLTGANKDKKIRNHAVLLPGSGGLDSLYEHLKALGVVVKNGEIEVTDDKLLGREVTLVLTERPTTKEGRKEPFVGVERVLPLLPGHRNGAWSSGSWSDK